MNKYYGILDLYFEEIVTEMLNQVETEFATDDGTLYFEVALPDAYELQGLGRLYCEIAYDGDGYNQPEQWYYAGLEAEVDDIKLFYDSEEVELGERCARDFLKRLNNELKIFTNMLCN